MAEIPSDPRLWKFADADAVLATALEAAVGKGGFESNQLFMAGKHWQNGIYWKGGGFDPETNQLNPLDKIVIEQVFTPIPVAPKCVKTRTDGACATEADFAIVPVDVARDDKGKPVLTAPEQKDANAWKADAGFWWKLKSYWQRQRECVDFASIGTGACLRVSVHPRAVGDRTAGTGDAVRGTNIEKGNRRAAFSVLELTAPSPAACGVFTHPDTLQQIAIFRFKTSDQKDGMELWFEDGGKTVLRMVTQDAKEAQEWRYPFGGELPIIPLENVSPILTEPVRHMQGSLDSGSTALSRLVQMHGFVARDEINAEPPGPWKTTPPADGADVIMAPQVINGVTYYKHPGKRHLGNSTSNSIPGFTYTTSVDDDARKETSGFTTPQIQYHEASDPENIIKGNRIRKAEIREACHQGHITDGSTAEASGDAYEQKRAVFEADISGVALAVAQQVAKTLTIATVMADWLAGNDAPDFAEKWSVDTQCKADAGPVSSEKQRGVGEMVDKGILSLPTAWTTLRVNDADAERDRLAADQALAVEKGKAEHAALLIAAGWNREAAWEKAGYTEDEIKKAVRSDFIPPEQ